MNIRGVLTPDELTEIGRRSDWQAWWLVLCNYAIVAATFAAMAIWPNPLSILLGILVLGGRQLGFGVLVHECGHGTLFRTRKLNDFVGDWLAGAPTFTNMGAYMRGHLHHHRLAGTEQDPDLPNYRDYPITQDRLRRKLWRDVTGRTGWRQVQGIFRDLLHLNQLEAAQRLSLVRGLVANAALFGALAAAGHSWLYLIWWAAFLTTNRLASRIRQVAEHGAVPDLFDLDPRRNTRTVKANWLERLILCPLGVNYHLEHHLLASVPIYNLPKMHRLLAAKGFYDGVRFPNGYPALLREVTVPSGALA